MYFVNEDIKNCVRVFPEQGRYDYARYDMNENPEGLPQWFVDEVLKEITPEFLATYPEHDKFRGMYAEYIGVKPENVAVTNGSDMAIRFAMEVFARKGGSVVTVAPSFEMYWVNCTMLGLKHVPVSYEPDMTMNVDKIIEAIDDSTDIVVLLNPNNPVGNVYTDEEARRIIERAREVEAVVIVDEAYHYFYKHTFLPFIHEYDNVMVFRTFSKLLSLAAVRLGMMIGPKELIGYARKSMPSFEVNAIALKFGEHMMQHPELIEELMETEAEGKTYLVEELSKRGYETNVSHGNFVFIVPKKPAVEIAQALREKKILIKTFGNEFLKKYVRISTGSKNAMKKFLDAFLEADQ